MINSVAMLGDYSVSRDIKYATHELNGLDVYVPKNPAENLPVVLFLYGGCWGGCTTYPKENYRFVAEALTSKGIIAVVADYRRYPEVGFPSMMEDTAAATQWVYQHIESYGGSRENIFLAGHSAGAHMAVTVALDPRYMAADPAPIAGVIGLAGPYDFLPFDDDYLFELFGPEEKWPDSQPVNFASGSAPPLLLLHGAADRTVGKYNSRHMAKAMTEQGGNATVILYDKIDHAGIIAAFSSLRRKTAPVLDDLVTFVRQHASN